MTPMQSGTMINNHCLTSLLTWSYSSEIYMAVLGGSFAAVGSNDALILSIGSIIST